MPVKQDADGRREWQTGLRLRATGANVTVKIALSGNALLLF
ncbi:TPA: hypothetical protein ACPYU1_001719 [Raoultella planticola]